MSPGTLLDVGTYGSNDNCLFLSGDGESLVSAYGVSYTDSTGASRNLFWDGIHYSEGDDETTMENTIDIQVSVS